MLRYTFNDDTRKKYDTLNISENDHEEVNAIVNALESFAKGVINESLERYTLNKRVQETSEKFLTDIKS